MVLGNSFDGTGRFKLALVNATGSNVYWRNSADANNDGEPDAFISLAVNRGIYAVAIGDTTLANMEILPPTVFTNSAVFLRVWFSDGVTGFQRLAPDQRITAVGYAMMAATVADGAITKEKLAPDLGAQLNSLPAVSADSQDATLASRGYQIFMTVPAPAWGNGSTSDAPSARSGHTAIWSGQEMLVWGGVIGSGTPSPTGGAYNPSTDQWRVLSPIGAPSARSGHAAVWTGTEMDIWGGATSSGYTNGGGRFDPVTQNWSAMPTNGAPDGRQGQVAVWNGNRMIIWGGQNGSGLLSDGALFDPGTNQWTTLTSTNSPQARYAATAVWTGNRFIVWGGQGSTTALNSGGQLAFASSVPLAAWQNLNTNGAPSARYGHTAVWTGQKMIVWGGRNGGVFSGDGAVYDPATDAWSPMSSTNAPSAREGHSAVWTGTEMVVFGGADGVSALASGAAYDPAANKWRTLTNPGSPVARRAATAIWSGTEMLLFGGEADGQALGALQRLNPQPAWYFYRKP